MVTNNQGNQNIYKYELFTDSNNATFETQLALSIGISGRCVPKNYSGIEINNDESLPLGKYPTCGWTADSFTNWLTQQAVNLPTKLVGTGAGVGFSFIPDPDKVGTGVAIGTPVGAGLGLITGLVTPGLNYNAKQGEEIQVILLDDASIVK